MPNVLYDSFATYKKNIKLILFFSVSFIIAMLIPVFVAFPTYADLGAIFIRTGSIYLNLNFIDTAIIVVATLFSLIFLSFAIVAINTIVKHSRTNTRIRKEVIESLEKHTTDVFVILASFTALLALVNFATYYTGYSGVATAIAAIILVPFMFYAPSSIIIDEKRPMRAIAASARFIKNKFGYFMLWLIVSFVLLSVVDAIPIAAGGTAVSEYAALVIDSLFVLPFLVVLQSETYIRRFAMLKR